VNNSTGFEGSVVLITGGLGFIGSNLALRLADQAQEVILVDNLDPLHGGNRLNIAGAENRLHVRVADLRDADAMRSLVPGCDFIFNLAGQSAHLDSMEDPLRDMELNCAAQLTLLEACRRYNPGVKLVFTSTRQVYGRPQYTPVDELHPVRPVDINGIHKAAAEQYHLLYREVYGLRSCVLRLTNTIGPRMRVRDARQTFLGVWIRCVVQGEPFEVWGGSQRRDFNYVDDVIDALLGAALDDAANEGVFNLGGAEVVTLRELADLLVELNGRGRYTVRQFPADRKRIDIGDYNGDATRIRRVLGWQQRTGLAEALSNTLDFYRQHLPQYL
jgi:UDP-glucose 4-epimerase